MRPLTLLLTFACISAFLGARPLHAGSEYKGYDVDATIQPKKRTVTLPDAITLSTIFKNLNIEDVDRRMGFSKKYANVLLTEIAFYEVLDKTFDSYVICLLGIENVEGLYRIAQAEKFSLPKAILDVSVFHDEPPVLL